MEVIIYHPTKKARIPKIFWPNSIVLANEDQIKSLEVVVCFPFPTLLLIEPVNLGNHINDLYLAGRRLKEMNLLLVPPPL